ncbi:MAG: hypothetical protein DDT20_00038 [Firmicutes bacterium]|nr:hypothetical protein [Bacillota bacterium]
MPGTIRQLRMRTLGQTGLTRQCQIPVNARQWPRLVFCGAVRLRGSAQRGTSSCFTRGGIFLLVRRLLCARISKEML